MVIQGQFEARGLVVGSEVIIGRAGNNLVVDVVEIDGGFRQCEVLKVVVEEWCVEGELVRKINKILLFEVQRVA